MNKLVIPTLRTFLLGAIALGVLLFLPAGTLDYWQAWVFIVVSMSSVNVIGVYLSLKDPALLERRKKFGPAAEQRTAQKIIISLAMIGYIALLIFCGLDHRFGWSPVPPLVSLAGDGLVALGLLMNLPVLKANRYAASNIRVFEGQKVATTGPYAFVRHPMYGAVLVMLTGVPLALDSWWGLVVVALAMPVLVWRILDEERFLKRNLPGYIEYTQKVRYRLVPYIW